MDAELKAKWVAALRSCKFEQAEGALYDGERYCCLGVLCEVADPGVFSRFGGDVETFDLSDVSPKVADNCGLQHDVREHLADMNDSGKPFEAIAAHIEANL